MTNKKQLRFRGYQQVEDPNNDCQKAWDFLFDKAMALRRERAIKTSLTKTPPIVHNRKTTCPKNVTTLQNLPQGVTK